MAFAIAFLINDSFYSEIPLNWLMNDEIEGVETCWWPPAESKNISRLMRNSAVPKPSKWQKIKVIVKERHVTFERACELVEDFEFHRNNINNKRPNAFAYSGEDNTEEQQETTTHLIKKFKPDPEATEVQLSEDDGNSFSYIPVFSDFTEANINPQSALAMLPPSSSNNSGITDLYSVECFRKTQEKVNEFMLKVEHLFNDLRGSANGPSQRAIPTGSTESVSQLLPLNTQDEVNNFERLLSDNCFLAEFKLFVWKQGGKNGSDYTKRVFSQVFTNKLASECSWKGRKLNFPINELALIKITRDTILDKFPEYQMNNFDHDGAEWFRLGSQRHIRDEKKKSTTVPHNYDQSSNNSYHNGSQSSNENNKQIVLNKHELN